MPHRCRVPETDQHYVDVGAGAPVLFVHGNPSWSYMWRRLLPVLSSAFRCIAPDLTGMGLSARPAPPAEPAERLRAQLGDLQALYGHLVTERGLPARGWTLVLHDWGGPLGVAWALRNPGVVERLVVLNTIGFRPPEGYRVPAYLRWIRDLAPLAALVHATNLFARIALRVGCRRRLPAEVRRAYLLPYARRQDRRAVVDFIRCIPRDGVDDPVWRELDLPDGSADLMTVPLFVGWGMKDPVFTSVLADEWQRRYPHAAVHRYPAAGHFVTEDAADELAGHIIDFLHRTEQP